MACKECGSKMVDFLLRKTWTSIIVAILVNAILIVGSYNYVQYRAYKKNIKVIKLESYKNEPTKINIEEIYVQIQNMNRIVR